MLTDHERGCLGWMNIVRTNDEPPWRWKLSIDVPDAVGHLARIGQIEQILALFRSKMLEAFNLMPGTPAARIGELVQLERVPPHEIRVRLPAELMLEYPTGKVNEVEAVKFADRVRGEVIRALLGDQNASLSS